MADVPGATEKDMEIAPGPLPGTLLLRIRVADASRPKSVLRAERNAGEGLRYERIVPVGWDADVSRAQGELDRGILKVTVPKQGTAETPAPPGPETR